MNPPRPSLAARRPDDSAYANNWIYQKSCYLCSIPLGYGQHRQKKLYCRECRKAICQQCGVDPPVNKESLCVRCSKGEATPMQDTEQSEFRSRPSIHGRFFPSEDLRLISPREPAMERSEDAGDRSMTNEEGVLRSAKSVLEELKRPAWTGERPPGLLSRLQAKLTDYEAELVDVRKQVGIRAEQLEARESSIETMTEKLQFLSQTNSHLEQRVAQLEKAIEQISEKGSEISSTTEAKADVCMNCAAF